MAKEIKLTYYGRVLSKKNSKQIIRKRSGAPVIVSNPAAKANENDMVDQFSIQTIRQTKPVKRCKISVEVYQPTAQRRDLDNQLTAILDALVKAEVIADDSFKCVIEEKVRFGGIDKNEPRAIVIITEVKDDE